MHVSATCKHMQTLARKIVISCHWSRSSFITVWKLDPASHTGGRMLPIPKNQLLEIPGQPSYIVAFIINRHHQWYSDPSVLFKFQPSQQRRQWMLLLEKPWPRLGWLDAETTCFKPRLPRLLQRKQGNRQHKIIISYLYDVEHLRRQQCKRQYIPIRYKKMHY